MKTNEAALRCEEPALRVEGLTVEFLTDHGWVPVLDDVSFSVGRGETVGIVGESGSGKTVTSMAIMGLLPRGQGRVIAGRAILNGTDLVGLGRRRLEGIRGNDIAMIFQEPMTSLNPAFTVGDQIAETIRRHRGVRRSVAWKRAVESLTAVGIPAADKRARSYPHEFSGGMRQRVMIAMAVCCEPALLIADEPTTALDVTIQAQVLDLLREMKERLGMSMLFITHDLGVVAEVCDRVAVMYAGQVTEQSSVVDLFHHPVHPYTEALLRSMPLAVGRDAGELYAVLGQPPAVGAFPAGCRFHPRCLYATTDCLTEPTVLLEIGEAQQSRCRRVTEITLGARRD